MTLQRRLLSAMLGLLALAALAGVSTIFLSQTDFIGRVAGTLFFSAVAIAMAIPSSKSLEKQSDRTRGLVTMLAIVVGLCLALTAVWFEYVFFGAGWDMDHSTLAYVATVVPALAFASLYFRAGGRMAGATGVGLAGVVFGSWLLGIWGRQVGFVAHVKWYETAGLFAYCAVPVSACLFGTMAGGKHWRFLGVAAAACGVVLGLIGIWMALGGKPTIIAHCMIVATVIGGANVLTRVNMPRSQAWLPLATTAMAVITGVLAVIFNHLSSDEIRADIDDTVVRLLTASLNVTVCGVLAIIVLLVFNKRFVVTEAKSLADIKTVTVHCPRCAVKQNAPLGESNCSGCNLIFLLRVAEPHCPKCNYVVLDIRGGRCPECGEPITSPTPPADNVSV